MLDHRVLSEVLTGFSSAVAGDFAAEDVLRELTRGVVRALSVEGAGVMVPVGDGLLRFAFAAGVSQEAVSDLERLQEGLQQGPCQDSHREGRLIDVADLSAEGHWPEFQERAVRLRLRAVTALPLQARGRTWGVLDLYRAAPRRMDREELAAARTLADVATSYLVVTADRDAAREAQQELAHRAMHDALTGLPVRWVFLEQLQHALARLGRHPGLVGVLFVDLDGLKYVNDTYGHDAGDRLLLACADRVRAALRPSDVVARVGGDEFVVLLEDLHTADEAAAVGRRILAELAAPYRPDGHAIQPSASLGLALSADAGQSGDGLISYADSAMYRAKRAGGGRLELFDARTYAADRARATAARDGVAALRTAVRSGQLRLHYQPIVDLTDPDGGVYAVEALVRWQNPQSGLLTAQQFVPDAERAGLMPELGAWVLGEACAQLARWDRELGPRSPRRLFVNVSVEELVAPGLLPRLTEVLALTGTAAARLTLEITETGLVAEAPAVARALAAVRRVGCQLALDDFGTGWSSLSRLVDLPASTVKIDGSFTTGVPGRPEALAVVSAVLELGRHLDRTVVVEGVEREDTLQALRRLGCTHAQGHHLGRPRPPDELARALAG